MVAVATYRLQGQSTGHIASVAVTAAGSGFTSAPTISFSGGGGTGAAAYATLSGDGVDTITVTDPGSGYTGTPTVVFTGGGGTGATATATKTAANTAIASAVVTLHQNGSWTVTTANSVKIDYPGDNPFVNALLETLLSGTGGITSTNLFGNTGVA